MGKCLPAAACFILCLSILYPSGQGAVSGRSTQFHQTPGDTAVHKKHQESEKADSVKPTDLTGRVKGLTIGQFPTFDTVFEPVFDHRYFLLGARYMQARLRSNLEESVYDLFYRGEEEAFDYLLHYISDSIVPAPGLDTLRKRIYSLDLNKLMEPFYDSGFKIITDSLYNDTEKLYSYIAGAYMRYGEKVNGNIYLLRYYEGEKAEIAYHALKELGCWNIFYKTSGKPGEIIIGSRSRFLYFQPGYKLKSYLTPFDHMTENWQTRNPYSIFLGNDKAMRELDSIRSAQFQRVIDIFN